MKKKLQIQFLGLVSIFIINGCTNDVINNDQVKIQNNDQKEYNAALKNVQTFNSENFTKSNDAFLIKSSSMKTYSFKLKEAKKTRSSTSSEMPDSAFINIFTFVFEKNGDEGFAIASGDERISRVYAYTENGRLSDTTYIEGLAYTLNMFPYIYEDELNNYYSSDNIMTKAAMTYISVGPNVITEWDQGYPYNNYCPAVSSSCTHTLVGCGGIATAQALAYLNPTVQMFGINYDILRSHQTPTFENQHMAALFCFNVANAIGTTFGCNASSSNLKNSVGFLQHFNITLQYYEGNLKINDCINSIVLKGITIARGDQNEGQKGGHRWLYDGVKGYMYPTGNPNWPYKKGNPWPTFHCNWGWGPNSSNGWYVASSGWEQPDSGTPAFLANNAQIYFLPSLH